LFNLFKKVQLEATRTFSYRNYGAHGKYVLGCPYDGMFLLPR